MDNVWIYTPESSNVKGFIYDGEKKILTVDFKSGGLYDYLEVPLEVFEGLVASESKGKFINKVKHSFKFSKHKDKETGV